MRRLERTKHDTDYGEIVLIIALTPSESWSRHQYISVYLLEVPIAIRPVPCIAANEAIEHVCGGLDHVVSVFDVACPLREPKSASGRWMTDRGVILAWDRVDSRV